VAETEARLYGLREKCLTRDHHRCVITGAFDLSEAIARTKRDGAGAKDDDKHFLSEETKDPELLQVAHIIPHSLMSRSGQLESKKTACNILDMFDNGVLRLIEGVDIDRPANALTLKPGLHQLFGDFEIYFEPTSGAQTSPTYTIHQMVPVNFPSQTFPITRTLLDTDKTIDLPSPRLLAIHRAVALILHLSGAGEYIDHILKDMDYTMVKSDGTTELGHLVSLRLGGWWDGIAVY